jgi:hypothetical protein
MDLYWTLVFLHVIAFAYWLGGDFGVYVTGGYVARADLPLAERLRFLDALLKIDILPRTGIVLLPVLGLQIAALRGAIFLPEWGKVLVWLAGAAWVAIVWGVFARRGTPLGERLQRIDVTLRYVAILALVVIGTWSLVEVGPVKEKWLAAKFLTYATLLAIGLYLRSVIKAWRIGFIELQRGPSESAERLIAFGIQRGRRGAWLFWAIIALTAYLGVAKPF